MNAEYKLGERSREEFLALLLELQEAEIPSVEIMALRDASVCEECTADDGLKMTIQKAIELQPLPHEPCPPKRCGCTYAGVMAPPTKEEIDYLHSLGYDHISHTPTDS